MNQRNNCNSCEPCFQPNPYACCQMPIDPLCEFDPYKSSSHSYFFCEVPVPIDGYRKQNGRFSKPKKVAPKRMTNKQKSSEKSPVDSCPEEVASIQPSCDSKRRSLDEPSEKPKTHPEDCCCSSCLAKNASDLTDFCESEAKVKKDSSLKAKKSTLSMSKGCPEKNLKNYLYDNPELKESNIKKSCIEIGEIEDDEELWLFQCPKDFDPKMLMNVDLSKPGKSQGLGNFEFSANKFFDLKTLAVISPEKAAEYELICDNLKLVKPVGKIVMSEKCSSSEGESPSKKSIGRPTQSKSIKCESEMDSEDEEEDDDDCTSSEPEEPIPVAGKKVKKNVNDQQFTIETTVTVGGRKKTKNQEKCLPFVPPEPIPSKKSDDKKRKSNRNSMNC